MMQFVYGSFHDCVVDAVASASAGFGCAHLEQVFTSLEQRSVKYYGEDGSTRTALEDGNCGKRVRRELFSSEAIYTERIDGVLCFAVSHDYAAEVYRQLKPSDALESVVGIVPVRALNPTILRELDTLQQRTFGSFRDCVVDAVASASGAYGSATLEQVLASFVQRSTKYYDDDDGSIHIATESEQYARKVRQVLFVSDAIRTIRQDKVTSFTVNNNYAAEVFMQPQPGLVSDAENLTATTHPRTEDSAVETVGSFRTLDSRVLSEVAKAALPVAVACNHVSEPNENDDVLINIAMVDASDAKNDHLFDYNAGTDMSASDAQSDDDNLFRDSPLN